MVESQAEGEIMTEPPDQDRISRILGSTMHKLPSRANITNPQATLDAINKARSEANRPIVVGTCRICGVESDFALCDSDKCHQEWKRLFQ